MKYLILLLSIILSYSCSKEVIPTIDEQPSKIKFEFISSQIQNAKQIRFNYKISSECEKFHLENQFTEYALIRNDIDTLLARSSEITYGTDICNGLHSRSFARGKPFEEGSYKLYMTIYLEPSECESRETVHKTIGYLKI